MDKKIREDAVVLASAIRSRCRHWFDNNDTLISSRFAVALLFTELSFVEVKLNGDSFLNPPDRFKHQKKDSKLRGDLIASIDRLIKQYPELESQLRPDLDQIWADFLPK